MFSTISLNPNKGDGKKISEGSQKNLKTNYEYDFSLSFIYNSIFSNIKIRTT